MKIVAISDQHGQFPAIPECDLLLVAGDLCPDVFSRVPAAYDGGARQKAWLLSKWLDWRKAQPAKYCLVTFGNHDFCGEKYGPGVHMLDPTTKLVFDDYVLVGDLTVWLTPWSNKFGDWALMGSEDELEQKYALIKDGVDILVSHQPPYGYLDAVPGVHAGDCPLLWHVGGGADSCTCGCEAHVGSQALVDAIKRVEPRAVICGHIHSGYGQTELEHRELRFNSGNAAEFVVGRTAIYNVSVVDEAYRMVNQPLVLEWGLNGPFTDDDLRRAGQDWG